MNGLALGLSLVTQLPAGPWGTKEPGAGIYLGWEGPQAQVPGRGPGWKTPPHGSPDTSALVPLSPSHALFLWHGSPWRVSEPPHRGEGSWSPEGTGRG